MATYYKETVKKRPEEEEDELGRLRAAAMQTQPIKTASRGTGGMQVERQQTLNSGTPRNQASAVQAANAALQNAAARRAVTQQTSPAYQKFAGNYSAASANGGNPYQIGSDKGKDFVQNAAIGASLVGGDGSQWYKNADGSVTITTKGGNVYNTPATRSMAMGNSDLRAQYADLFDQLNNYAPFEYDPAVDPLYQNYKKQYTREGQRAMQDTMGQYAAMTGGLPSTAAMTAASQANDYYMAQMADKIPELYQLAYGMYVDDYNRLADRYGMAYQQFNDDLANEWKGLYNKQDRDQQDWSNRMAEDEYNYQKTLDAWDQDYKNRLFNWDQETYNQDRAWDREQFYAELAANNAYQNASLAQDAAELAEKRRQYDAEQAAEAAEAAAVQQRANLTAAAKQAAKNTVTAGMNVLAGKTPVSSGSGLVQNTAKTGASNVLQQAAAAAAQKNPQKPTVPVPTKEEKERMTYDDLVNLVERGYMPTEWDKSHFKLSDIQWTKLRIQGQTARAGIR